MRLQPFQLERYLAEYEFTARHLVSSSDCESFPMHEVVSWADDECRALWEALWLGYTESQGLPQLRREIARLYDGIDETQVLEVIPEEGILLAMTTILEPGDHVICAYPSYQTLWDVAEQLGCEVTYWKPDEAQGWRFDPAFVRAQLRPTTKLIVANFPHNPTGYLPTPDEQGELLEIAAEAGAYLFMDEMYRLLEWDGREPLPSAATRYERAVSLSGMSKTFSLPGLRVGWLTTRDGDLFRRLAEAKDYTTICASAPTEVLALIGLRERERIVARNLATIAANWKLLEEFAADHPGLLGLVRPRGGSICFARLRPPEGGGTLAFCRLAAEASVVLTPSTVFGYGDEHVRFGLGRAAFGEGLAAFSDWLARS